MITLYSDGPVSTDSNPLSLKISCSDKMIKVELTSIYQGEGYTYLLDKKYIPDIDKSNAASKIAHLMHYKYTADYDEVCVKYLSGKTPFRTADDPNTCKKNVMF